MVSVIMPAFNAEDFIEEAIQSVLNQTYPHWDLIIVDDASIDNTTLLIDKFHKLDKRIKFFKNTTNLGTAESRNRAIEAAKGEYIAFLDADDLWLPKKLEKQLEFMQSQNLAVCFSSYGLISENGKDLNLQIEALPELTYAKLLKANYVGNLTGIYNVKKLGKIYAPKLRKRQDWALWLQALKKGGPAGGIKENLALYRIRKKSLSTNKLEMLRYNFKIYHEVLGYSFAGSFWKMLIFLREQFFIKSRQQKRLQ